MTQTQYSRERAPRTRTPVVDVFQGPESVVMQFELPGIAREDIKVDVDKDTLRIETTAQLSDEGRGETLVSEFDKANFAREFVLSRDLDRENITASWANGVLTLSVPKAAAARPRKIEIGTE